METPDSACESASVDLRRQEAASGDGVTLAVPRTIHVCGIDPSLTGTGVAVLGSTPDDTWTTHTFTVSTTGRDSDDDARQLDRMCYVVSTVADVAAHSDVLVIERPAFAARGSATVLLAGLYWELLRRVLRWEIPTVLVTPSSLKKYATSKGNADKRTVSRATALMWPEVATKSGDEDDALVLASIGADMLDLPMPYERTKYRSDALSKIVKPDNWQE